MKAATLEYPEVDPAQDGSTAESTEPMSAIVERVCRRIAPLWPLKNFVAVNPFVGFTDQPFDAACTQFRQLAGIELLMPRAFYRDALKTGRIEANDLADAVRRAHSGSQQSIDMDSLRRALESERPPPSSMDRVATVSDILDEISGGDRQTSRTAFMIDEISKWCGAYFDEGQAALPLPQKGLAPYAAWRIWARDDRTPEILGLRSFRRTIASLPLDPQSTIAAVIRAQDIPAAAIEQYLLRALLDIKGWAAYARYRQWSAELSGGTCNAVVELLAIRVGWGFGLFCERTDPTFRSAWGTAVRAAAARSAIQRDSTSAPTVDLVLQEAYERGFLRRLLERWRPTEQSEPTPGDDFNRDAAAGRTRKSLQAVFCIDVRSEPYRRALESVCPEAETAGFAGFFGFPIEYVPIGMTQGKAHCPVLLKPAFAVHEGVRGTSDAEAGEILRKRLLRRRAAKAWKAFKMSAVSSFAYVEAIGLWSATKLIGNTTGWTRPVQDPNTDKLPGRVLARLGPQLDAIAPGARSGTDEFDRRVDLAEKALRAMSLAGNFARIVLLVGHGSTSTNNPHSSSLDCGACGGHSGEANARLAAAIFNDPEVRKALAKRGIDIPEDTWFIAGLHDTTTDSVKLFDTECAPRAHGGDLERTREALKAASKKAVLSRASRFRIRSGTNAARAMTGRSRDWSQVRPEWGLAGNAVFIAAPRERTRAVDLEGRAFLHSYDWRRDEDFSILELIMTAPMIVASWINLQYYGSVVDNSAFGSGNKTLHNVVGQLGVLEGNAGDLRSGLPWQSLHDGHSLVHEPVRLHVFIEAPVEAIQRVLRKHSGVRALVENRWIHLFALDGGGGILRLGEHLQPEEMKHY